MTNRCLKSIEAVIEGQKKMPAEGKDNRSCCTVRNVEQGHFGPVNVKNIRLICVSH